MIEYSTVLMAATGSRRKTFEEKYLSKVRPFSIFFTVWNDR